MVGFNGIELRFVLTELKLSVERELTGTGEDELGTFTIKGTVNRAGFAEFIKEYTTGKLKPVTQFFGNFINACIIGNWVIKEQGTGRFEMRMTNTTPFSYKVGNNPAELLHIAFPKQGERIHSCGLLSDPEGSNKRFFIMNGKLLSNKSEKKEIAIKMVFPQSTEHHYFIGKLTVQADGVVKMEGNREKHKSKGLFSGKPEIEAFEMTSVLPNTCPPTYAIPVGFNPFIPQSGYQAAFPVMQAEALGPSMGMPGHLTAAGVPMGAVHAYAPLLGSQPDFHPIFLSEAQPSTEYPQPGQQYPSDQPKEYAK